MTRPFTYADVELVAETVAADLGLETWQVRYAARSALRALAAAGGRAPVGEYEVDVVFADGSVSCRRVGTERSALAAADSVDEHGNRPDTCSVCTLVPSVSGWARVTQARCPVHGSRPHAEPHVLSWDWREQPDLAQLARVVRDVSGGTVHVREVDTGSDQFAIVIAGTDLDEADTQAVYERWLHCGLPDTEEGDTDGR